MKCSRNSCGREARAFRGELRFCSNECHAVAAREAAEAERRHHETLRLSTVTEDDGEPEALPADDRRPSFSEVQGRLGLVVEESA